MSTSSMRIYGTDQPILADAHVHIYDCFDLDEFLDAAFSNFQVSASRQGYGDDFAAVLLLTETSQDHYFQVLWAAAEEDTSSTTSLTRRWRFSRTQEAGSLYASLPDGKGMWLIAGRQIVTAEDLEVLALATADQFQDGQPIGATIQAVIASGGVPVVPWGFGKWFGRRGTILSDLLEQKKFPVLFLGDNSGRPIFWQRPSYFRQAESTGLRVLPGTDPLPFASEVSRPGRFGFSIRGPLHPAKPMESLKSALLNPATPLKTYGALENPWRFFRNQLAMQIIKRKRKAA